MGKLNSKVDSWTEKVADGYHGSKVGKTMANVSSVAGDVINIAGKAALLTLSKAWIGIGLIRPAKTDATDKLLNLPDWAKRKSKGTAEKIESESGMPIDRFDYEKLFSLQLGDYFMPLSQTFTLRAKKKLNTSSLVDGVDIIQQTRKESKTIECVIRIGLRGVNNFSEDNGSLSSPVNKNLQIVDMDNEIQRLSWFLSELYETDAVFFIGNEMINNTFGVTHVIMSEYKFTPRVGMGTYTFEFALTEVKYGDNVLTMDLTQVNSSSTLTGD